jgi:crotonobetainyl-CoA:carnitine CoA-transferase CaiB-like acyl-CoA transferase
MTLSDQVADPGGIAGMLAGLKVLEIGDTVAASAAGALCAKLGADVVKVKGAFTVGSRREGHSAPTQRDRLLELLDRGKTEVEAGPDWKATTAELCRDGDITFVDVTEADYWRRPAGFTEYQDFVREHNSGCWVSVSPFGLDGPLSGYRGSDLTVAATGGVVGYMLSGRGRPMKPAGFITAITSGHLAVLAGLHGLLERDRGRPVVHMDLSAQDTVIVTGVFLEIAHQVFECGGDGGAARYAAPRGLIPCGSGFIWIVVIEDHQWLGCVRAIGQPDWASGITTAAQRAASYELIQRGLAEWASQYSARKAAELLQANGVPATAVNSCADLLAGSGLDVPKEFFVPGARSGEILPGVPFELGEHIASRAGAGTSAAPDRRHRILDLTQVLVGPLATSWLGAMGIDVLKVEDLDRIDVYRRRGPFLQNAEGLERGAYFSLANHSKRSHSIRYATPEGKQRLEELIDSADAVVHNLGRRAVAMGVTPEKVGAHGCMLVSCSGFASSCGYGNHRAYGMNIQAAGGIVYLSRDRDGHPINLGTSWADAASAVWLAILTASQLLRPAAERHSVDVSMVEVVAEHLPEYFSALTADHTELIGHESQLDHAVPHGVYECRDGYVALTVESDEDWQRLVELLGCPSTVTTADLKTLPGRQAARDTLDVELDELLSSYSSADLFELGRRAGIACAPVWRAADLLGLSHLRERGLLQELEHPVWGRRALVGLPWRVDGKPVAIGRTPMLGEHTSDNPQQWWEESLSEYCITVLDTSSASVKR